MARTAHVSLEDKLYMRAKRRAEALGISVDDYIRDLVAEALPERNRRAERFAFIGLGASGEPTNIAKDKHRLIAEAIAADKLK